MRTTLAILTLALAIAPAAQAKKGFYFGFNLGYATVSGDTAITMQNPELDPDSGFDKNIGGLQTDLRKLFTTEVGEGFNAEFRMGYNILGFVAIEANIQAHGNNLSDSNKLAGVGFIGSLVRFFPAQIFREVDDRWWDPYIFIGGGVYFMGFNPDAHPEDTRFPSMINDGRAWFPSAAVKYGLGVDFYIVRFFSMGIDLAFVNGFHDTFRIDNEEDVSTSPVGGSAGSFSFAPTAKLTFHFGTED